MRNRVTIFSRIFHFPFWLMIVHVESIDPSQCIAPLGMENGMIKDRDVTASSSFDHGNVGPHHGRIRSELNGGAWCPQTQATSETKEWIEIDLHVVHMITATEVQGRFGNGQGVEFAEAYVLEYFRPKLNKWIRYQTRTNGDLLKGNINTYLEEKTVLDPPIWASKIRFLPYSSYKRTVCMRVELYGCRWSDGIVSYSMPQGDKKGANWEFYDFTYDGLWDGHNLNYGLGQLVDSQFAPDDFKDSFHHGNSQGWIGWKNDTKENNSIEIIFEFDKVREFTALHIYANNQFTREVQVFSEAKVFFSVGGKKYKGEPNNYEYIEDKIFESPRNVSMKLHHRVGRFVKLRLQFAARWMLISEVSFESFPVSGSFIKEEEDDKPKNISANGDQVVSSRVKEKTVISAVNYPSSSGEYLGIIVGILVVMVILMLAVVLYVMVQQRRSKSSPRPGQIPVKAALYRTSSFGHITTTCDYVDVRDPEYAVPLQPSLQSPPTPQPFLNSQNILPAKSLICSHPPSASSPSDHYYAATEICKPQWTPSPPLFSSKFTRPPPPACTPPAVRLQRQPRYVPDRMYIEPQI